MPHFSLPAEPAMVRVARRRTARLLGDDPRTADALLIVSELFTNSVLHSASGEKPATKVRVTLVVSPAILRVQVEDDGPRQTPATGCREDGEFGRGWEVVEGVASKCGHDTYPNRGVAWAELRAEYYRATTHDGSVVLPADLAREAYDLTPEHLRRGLRETSFMLLDEDDRGFRIPTVYKPITDTDAQPTGH